MNIRELHIGDIVRAGMPDVDGGERLTPNMKVVGIWPDEVSLEIDPEQGDAFTYNPSEIRGIVLNRDILLDIGFAVRKTMTSSVVLEYGGMAVVISGRRGECVRTITSRDKKLTFADRRSVLYVHEFQHIMAAMGEYASFNNLLKPNGDGHAGT